MRAPLPRRLAAVLLLAALTAACGGEPFQPTHTGVVPLDGEATAGQTFRSASGQVRHVDLLVATYGRAADAAGTLTVTLHAEPGGAALATATVPGDTLADNTWVAVAFPDGPVDVGPGAAFEVAWDGAEPVALRANLPPADWPGDRLLNDPYPGGELLRDGRPATGDLAFRVAGAPAPAALAGELARLARGALWRLLDRPAFAVAWLLLLAGAAALVLLPGRRRARP